MSNLVPTPRMKITAKASTLEALLQLLESNLEDVQLDENIQLWLDNLVDRILTMATGKN